MVWGFEAPSQTTKPPGSTRKEAEHFSLPGFSLDLDGSTSGMAQREGHGNWTVTVSAESPEKRRHARLLGPKTSFELDGLGKGKGSPANHKVSQ